MFNKKKKNKIKNMNDVFKIHLDDYNNFKKDIFRQIEIMSYEMAEESSTNIWNIVSKPFEQNKVVSFVNLACGMNSKKDDIFKNYLTRDEYLYAYLLACAYFDFFEAYIWFNSVFTIWDKNGDEYANDFPNKDKYFPVLKSFIHLDENNMFECMKEATKDLLRECLYQRKENIYVNMTNRSTMTTIIQMDYYIKFMKDLNINLTKEEKIAVHDKLKFCDIRKVLKCMSEIQTIEDFDSKKIVEEKSKQEMSYKKYIMAIGSTSANDGVFYLGTYIEGMKKIAN